MAFKSYLLERYEFTHENRFFRNLNNKLKSEYENQDGNHILIGNISVGGHSLDAIFIKSGAIIVIDFKDYSGKLKFSENGPWRLTTNTGKTIFVAGGKHSRNPYQQVNAYRFSLFKYLSENEKNILDDNHFNIDWSHTNCIVLFHHEVEFENEQIPPKIQRYFHVSHFDNFQYNLNDIYSQKLNLSDKEIDRILQVLNITHEDLFDATIIDDEQEAIGQPHIPIVFDKALRLIPNVEENANENKRALSFYYTMLSIERINDTSVESVTSISIDWSQIDKSSHKIQINHYPKFSEIWMQNIENQFPKNLFVSVDVLFDELKVPLFYTIIQHTEIEKHIIDLNFDKFDLYRPILEELQLDEHIIDEVYSQTLELNTIEEKINQVKEYLDLPISLINQISFGLSNESVYTSQLKAELNNWIKGKIPIQTNEVFNAILTHKPIQKLNVQTERNLPLIQVSELNQSQREGLNQCFEQPLTVVSGPPGTGKSQLVTNIIANAVVRGEKLLFASKNNKAVDNVNDKLNENFNTNYFLRLGSSSLNKSFIEVLDNIISSVHLGEMDDKSQDLLDKTNFLKEITKEKNQILELLNQIQSLEIEISNDKLDLKSIRVELKKWVETLSLKSRELYYSAGEIYNIPYTHLNELSRVANKANSSLFSKFWFNIFSKSKFKERLKENFNSLSINIQNFVDSEAPIISQKGNEIEGYIDHLNFILNQKKEQEFIDEKKTNFNNKISSLQETIGQKENKLSYILENQDKFEKRISNIIEQEKTLGKELLALTINERLRTADLGIIDTYRSYIQNGLPWQANMQEECKRVIDAFLTIFNSISITALNVKKGFLQQPEVFDILVIDEASQCDITSALPLIYRAKRVVIIGDSLQLPHITSVKKQEEKFVLEKLNLSPNKFNYTEDSLYKKSERISYLSQLESAYLDEHYRCHPDIINFSNENFYQLQKGGGLTINTYENDFNQGEPGLHWINVKGKMTDGRNENMDEVDQSIHLLKKLVQSYPEATFGITTPFRHQADALKKELNRLNLSKEVTCEVIHKFQGDEKDIMILSLAVTHNSKPSLSRFINTYSPYLLNVAVTRAKSALYIVGNYNYCYTQRDSYGQKTLLAKLAHYNERINT